MTSSAEALSLACLGALTRDTQHEALNLLAVAGAWTSLNLGPGSEHADRILAISATAIGRLTQLHESLRLCSTPTERTPFGDSVASVVGHATTVNAPRIRVAQVTVKVDLPHVRLHAPTRPYVLAVALILRCAIERVANAPDRTIEVYGATAPHDGLVLEVRHASPAARPSEDPANADASLWEYVGLDVARHWLARSGGSLTVENGGEWVAFRIAATGTPFEAC